MKNYLTVMNCKSELEFSLPNIECIKITSSIDRFGFSSILSSMLDLKFPYRPFCNWIQGWAYGDIKSLTEEDFVVGLNQKNISYIVSDENQKILLEKYGYKDVTIGGLPFCYIQKPKVERVKNSAIFMLPKYIGSYSSNDGVISNQEIDNLYNEKRYEFIKYVHSVKNDFTKAVVCIFPPNLDTPELINLCEKYGLEVVVGSSPFDRNALTRMAMLFSQFEYCISNWFGSHIVYSNMMGAKCCIVAPFLELRMEKKSDNWHIGHSENYLRSRYRWLFVHDYKMAINNEKWAMEVSGCNYKLPKDKLIKVLGWSFVGQINGMINAFLRRI
jgi:hypothetical protein